jgi:hypothetical protein
LSSRRRNIIWIQNILLGGVVLGALPCVSTFSGDGLFFLGAGSPRCGSTFIFEDEEEAGYSLIDPDMCSSILS